MHSTARATTWSPEKIQMGIRSGLAEKSTCLDMKTLTNTKQEHKQEVTDFTALKICFQAWGMLTQLNTK